MRRLRLLAVHVQPVLVWDDGTVLSPGPTVAQSAVVPAELDHFPAALRAQLDDLARQLETEGTAP